jgi:hypothetical protein
MKLLPTQEEFVGLQEIRRAREACAISGEEAEKYGDKTSDGAFNINFGKTAGVVKEIPLGEWMTGKIQDILRGMDKKHDLEMEHMSLFEKFIVNFRQF